jgi:molybdopterin/thiamine biosynthesis adenylyltransferase
VPEVYRRALQQGIYPYRYIRNGDGITLQEQLKLAESCVSVVGAGGLGGQIILLLARIGVGRLVVVDHDVFDETNLNRQALSSTGQLGNPKVRVAAETVAAINPGVVVESHQVKITDRNAVGLLTGAHVVVDALDSVGDRFVVQAAARELCIPMVHGALAGFEGQLMTIYPEDPGLELLYGGAKAPGKPWKTPEAVLGVPTLTPAFVATLQCGEVIKTLLGRGRPFRKIMLHVDLEQGRMNEFALE